MTETNPKLIYQLRQQPRMLPKAALQSLYADGATLDEDLAVLQRHGLVTVTGQGVAWKGT